MAGFTNEEEKDAWTLAESLIDRGRMMMRQAERALESYMVGKELNRQRCSRRGIGATDAEIRWGETTTAQKALADNSFHVSQAMLYYGAAAANYARALYLRDQGADTSAAKPPEQPNRLNSRAVRTAQPLQRPSHLNGPAT